MSAVWVRARSELRRQWRSTVVVAALVGLVAGLALFGVAGARRTSSAMDRFLTSYRPFDAFVFGEELPAETVAALPRVVDVDIQSFLLLAPSNPSGEPDPTGSLNPFLTTMGAAGSTSQRPIIVAGRLPDHDEALEVAVNEDLVRRQGVGVGDTLRVWAYRPAQFFEVLEAPGAVEPAGPALDLRVTGVVRHPSDISPDPVDDEVAYSAIQSLYLSPGFADRYGDEVASYESLLGPALVVRLAGGPADLDHFTDAVRALPGAEATAVEPVDTRKQAANTERATDFQALALVVVALLVATAGMVVVGPALARQVQVEAEEHPTLRAIGMTPAQRWAVIGLRALLVGGIAAVVAVGVAVVLSPLSPVGLARLAEPDPGVAADLTVLGLGAVVVVAAVAARMALAAWRVSRGDVRAASAVGPRRRPSALVERLASSGTPAAVVVGVGMAVQPERAGGASLRGGYVGTTVAVASVVAGLVFTAALGRLLATPELQGWTWDVTVGDETIDIADKGRRLLGQNPFVGSFSAISGSGHRVDLGGAEVQVTALERIQGDVGPPLAEGRLAERGGEVVLGTVTSEDLDLAVGDDVEVTAVSGEGAGRSAELEVVGIALLGPALNYTASIGEGLLVTFEDLGELFGDTSTAYFLVDYANGAAPGDAFASLQADWGRQVLRPLPAPDVENLRRVSGIPIASAGLVAVLGVVTLGHLLATSVRRRRRDLAVLRAIGFNRGQIWATVAWQATTVVTAALVVGLPLGVGAGRWAWRVVADGIGTPASPVTPVLAVVLAAPLALLAANLVAALPARAAARIRPALALRAE